MSPLHRSVLFDRRQFLTGAGLASIGSAFTTTTHAEAPSPPLPVRIQTPDLAFAEPLRQLLGQWSRDHESNLKLSIVPAEPASDSLLNDARTGQARFSGAIVPGWLLSDLVRDGFIVPATPPPTPLPSAIAQLRSFGGAWVATDFDHDCDLLYYRPDLLAEQGLSPAQTWDELLNQSIELFDRIGGGTALPQTHAQQVVDHFASMAAVFVMSDSTQDRFWFDPETMQPAIDSDSHIQALDRWRALARTTPLPLRSGSTGELWQSLLDGTTAYLLAPASFFPYAVDRGAVGETIGVSELPGLRANDGTIARVGNATGPNWGGVVLSRAGEKSRTEIRSFLLEISKPASQTALWSDPSTGMAPAVSGSAELVFREEAGWPEHTTSSWLDAIRRTLNNPTQLPPLRIAETRRYLQALEDRIVPFLASENSSAADTLSEAAKSWDEIDRAIGIEIQQRLFEQSLIPAPAIA